MPSSRFGMGHRAGALWLALGAALVAAGCPGEERSPGQAPPATSTAATTPVTSLTESIAPLREVFNAARGKHRFVAFLSPTCPACLAGARAIRAELVEAPTPGRWLVAIVWIPMLPTDEADALERAAAEMSDPRVRQFFDGSKLAGRAFGRTAFPGFSSPAWDVYLFYPPEARWSEEQPPPPARRLAQFLGPDRQPLVASDLDEDQRPIPLGPGSRLGELLRQTRTELEQQP